MEFKGTKGKWELNGELKDTFSPIEVIVNKKTIVKIVAYDFWNVPVEECKSNAKIIKAAPEMFEMLKELLYKISDEYSKEKDEIEQLLTKITK